MSTTTKENTTNNPFSGKTIFSVALACSLTSIFFTLFALAVASDLLVLSKNGEEYIVERTLVYAPSKGDRRVIYVLRSRRDPLGNELLHEESYNGAGDAFSPREIVTFRGLSLETAYKRLDNLGQVIPF